jgi:prepilin signal peptidase PulO-like enzyme (type II secretory pathway)
MDFFAELPASFLVALAFILGLAIGSFLNVVIQRVPRGEPIAWPGSRCPQCLKPILPFDNLPLLSYAWLRGRCRECRQRIPWRYPAVELLTALLFAALVWRNGADWLVLAQLVFVAALVALIFIDAQHQLLPDVINYPLLLGALAVAPLRNGWSATLTAHVQATLALRGSEPDFNLWQAALCGALILALATPLFLLLDWLDAPLFDRYFEEEDLAAENLTLDTETAPPADDAADEQIAVQREQKRRRVILGVLLLGFLLAVVWAVLVYRYAPAQPFVYQRAYDGLLYAFASAAGAAALVWVLRALYFVVRGIEGMGLGDVKMMAALGAFLGWYSAFGVLLYSSMLGAVAGLIIAGVRRSGLNTAFPFGVFLGAMAIVVLLTQ